MLSVATESAASIHVPPVEPVAPTVIDTRYADHKIIRRNGSVVGFAPNKIAIAVTKAFIAVQGDRPQPRRVSASLSSRSPAR
jgi:ribonucleoside-diphosphate reductase alpha chain